MPARTPTSFLFALTAATLAACQAPIDRDEGELVGAEHANILPGSPEETAVLAVVNDPAVTQPVLDDDVGLDVRAATNIIAHRSGSDGQPQTADDNPFDSIVELDDVPYVGNSALEKLLAYAKANGYFGGEPVTAEALDWAMLAFASDASVPVAVYDDDAGLDKRAAENIVAYRDGVDGVPGTPDDRVFMTVAQLDDIAYVGASALDKLRAYAVDHGYLDQLPSGTRDVVFSPQPYSSSHNARVADVIDAATTSLDIAMYSFSDAAISDAIEAAVARGVKVRFVFDTASDDRTLVGTALDNSKSARLENMGVNVRWVNKIMHHKFMIVDGPRDSAAAAETATLVTGSGNWSYGAATKYDENTLFLDGQPELALRLQGEFNRMWEHAHDFEYNTALPYELSTLSITESMIPQDPGAHAVFTSANFNVSGETFSINGGDTVSDALVAAIGHASDSIWIASGHLRSRPVAEALMAKHQADPSVDIRVYLDDQEYISSWYHAQQLADRDDCLAAASSPSQIRQCYDKGFLFGYQVGESGIAVRYKFYAFRWDYSYAAQMHNKFMLIDGDELWTGSYNLSDNAEHNTFENMVQLRGLSYANLIGAYRDQFLSLWNTRRDDGSLAELQNEIATAANVPLVFDAMALDHAEVTALKQLIVDNCPVVYTDPYKDAPASHQYCPR